MTGPLSRGLALPTSQQSPVTQVPGQADVRVLQALAGPAVLDALLDRVDLPAGALVAHGKASGGMNLLPGEPTPAVAAGLSERRDGLSSPLLAARDGLIDMVALQQRLQQGDLAALQVRDAWRWMPAVRRLMHGLEDRLRLHARLDLLLVPPGGRVGLMATHPDLLLCVGVFGDSSWEVIDGNPAFHADPRSRDGIFALPGGPPPLRRHLVQAEPGTMACVHGERAVTMTVHGHRDQWSGVMMLALHAPRWEDLLRDLVKQPMPKALSRVLDPAVDLAALLPAGGDATSVINAYWVRRRDPSAAVTVSRLLDLMNSIDLSQDTRLRVRQMPWPRVRSDAALQEFPGILKGYEALCPPMASVLMDGQCVVSLPVVLAPWLRAVLCRTDTFTVAELPEPPPATVHALRKDAGADLDALTICRQLLGVGVLSLARER